MSQYKDTSLKDLLQSFIHAQGEWAYETRDRQSAESDMQAIAGELNRRFYITQQQNQALIGTLEALVKHFGGLNFRYGSENLANDLEQIKAKLQGSSHE
jgi:phage gpG-like protein